MIITPNSEVIMLKVPLTPDCKNQLKFKYPNQQFEYFRFTEGARPYQNCSYIRKEGVLEVPGNFDELSNYNYCMYQNSDYSGKWYYCFILKHIYVNDNVTRLVIATDYWQTYCFDMSFKMSFIEREMLSTQDDVPGANLEPEGLEIGEPIEEASSSVEYMQPVYVLAYSRNPCDDGYQLGSPNEFGSIINNIATGIWYCIGSAKGILTMLKTINDDGHGESVIAVFTIPAISIYGKENLNKYISLDDDIRFWPWDGFSSSGRDITLNSTPTQINGYTPKNKKLLTYPYCYLGFNPTNGNSKIYRYENFSDGTPRFKVRSEINPNPQVYFIPENYKGSSGVNVSESGVVSGYPSIGYHTDFFNNWLAQNNDLINLGLEQNAFNFEFAQGMSALSYGLKTVGALGTIASGDIAGGLMDFAGASMGAVSETYQRKVNYDYGVQETMLQKEKQSMLPNSASMGSSNTTLLAYNYMNDDVFTRYNIKRQFAEKIDEFFSMYGYKTNKLKLPNLDNRSEWNYVKTVGANITGANIPSDDLFALKQMFNDGVTFWHKPENYLDYTKNNV
jgi:hypothetical protein